MLQITSATIASVTCLAGFALADNKAFATVSTLWLMWRRRAAARPAVVTEVVERS